MTLLLLALSVVAAVIPITGFLGVVWWLDRYDREPLWLVGLTYAWGAMGAVLLALIGNAIGYAIIEAIVSDETLAMRAAATFVAPLVEEPTKAIILLLVMQSRHFDNVTDGFVYGAAAGLGFAMTENFLYFAEVAQGGPVIWGTTVVIRTLYSAVMHATATSVVGAALGIVRFRGLGSWIVVVPAGLAVAMGIHALWNGLLSLDEQLQAQGALFLANLALFPFEFLTIFVLFQACLFSEHRLIRRELQAEADTEGTIPAAHVPVISSFLARGRRGWLQKGIPHHAYVRAATLLAFRLHQHANTRGDTQAFFAHEVDRLRDELRDLQRRANEG